MSDPPIILQVEDREDDVFLLRRAFREASLNNPLYVVSDGVEAISYLKGEGKFANREEYPLPDLLLLDLKMPRCDGFEVLRWIRQKSNMKALRVVVFTSSEEKADVDLAYKLGANSFLVKPVSFEKLIETCRMLTRYWLTLDKIPQVSRLPGEKVPEPIDGH